MTLVLWVGTRSFESGSRFARCGPTGAPREARPAFAEGRPRAAGETAKAEGRAPEGRPGAVSKARQRGGPRETRAARGRAATTGKGQVFDDTMRSPRGAACRGENDGKA